MKILIPVVVGVIIGYFTNWLAIKMLFRPHYEKRFLGIKIPFTPGLIPKERKRIAESIGKAVGRYLLSPDTIIESLSNQGVGKKIQGWVEERLDNLRNNHKTVKEVLENTWEDYLSILNTIKWNITSFILSQIRKEQFINKVVFLLEKKIGSIDTNSIYDFLEEQFKIVVNDLANSRELKEGLEKFISENINVFCRDERTLAEILPADIQEFINKYIEENKKLIGQSIKNILKEPNIQNKIKHSISCLITENISKIFFAFINPDYIAEKIFSAFERYIDNDETNNDIVFILKTLLNRLMTTKVSYLLPKIMDCVGEESISQIIDKIIRLISNGETQNLLLGVIKNNLKAKKMENKEKVLNYLDRSIKFILNLDEVENTIFDFVSNFIDEILDKPVSIIMMRIDNENLSKVYNFIEALFKRFLEKDLAQIVEFFDVEKVVVDKLNSFEVDFLEEIILEIAEKELKAITWLGGLLGGILGLLSPLLEMLY